MGLHSRDRHVVPPLPQRAGNYADRNVRVFEHRTLFDMGLKVGAESRSARIHRGWAWAILFDCGEGLGRIERIQERKRPEALGAVVVFRYAGHLGWPPAFGSG